MSINEKDINLSKKKYPNLSDIREEIKRLDGTMPENKRTKVYKDWRKDINFLIEIYNARVGYAYYQTII